MAKVFVSTPHGGGDPGAVGGGESEVSLIYPLVDRLVEYLRANGVEVMEFHANGDSSEAIHEICNASNAFAPDLTLQIHMNASGAGTANGVEYEIMGDEGDTSHEWAEKIAARLSPPYFKDGYGRVNYDGTPAEGGIRKGRYNFTVWTDAPAILLELGFIDNDQDRDRVKSNSVLLAQLIGQATLEQLGMAVAPVDMTPAPDPPAVNPTPDTTFTEMPVVPFPPFTFNVGGGECLGLNDDSPQVPIMERCLLYLGYIGYNPRTTLFDNYTLNGVMAFQAWAVSAKLLTPPVDGLYGVNTATALKKAVSDAWNATHPVVVPPTPPVVEPPVVPPPVIIPPLEPPATPPDETPGYFKRFIQTLIDFLTKWL